MKKAYYRQLLLALILGSLVWVIQTGSADAATVSTTSHQVLVSTSLSEEANDIRADITTDTVTITDYSTPLSTGNGCTSLTTYSATCELPGDPSDDYTYLSINLGLGDDIFRGIFSTTPIVGNVLVNGNNGDDIISVGSNYGVSSGHSMEILGGDGDDTITGSDNNDSLYGGSGGDTLYGMGGDDFLAGGDDTSADLTSDNDSIYGGDGNDYIAVGLSNDKAYGEDGNDIINTTDVSGDISDEIYGGSGDDIIQIRSDAIGSLVEGGAGNDLLIIYSGGYLPEFYGGDGGDILDYSSATANLNITQDNLANDGLASQSGNLHDDVETIYGGSGNDYISGGNENNTIDGKAGNDTLLGGGGNDVLIGGSGTDVFDGGDGDDSIQAKDNTNEVSIVCGSGSDTAQVDLLEYVTLLLKPAAGCETLSL